MTHDMPHPSEPWRALPAGFAERLDMEAKLGSPARSAALERAAIALHAPPAEILDLGSGTGVDAVALAQRFPSARVHAVDVSAELLDRVASAAVAAHVAEQIERHLADLDGDWRANIPQDVDLAWASLSLHHLSDPAAVLRQIFTALRPGGVFVMTELPGDWAQLLADAGFTDVDSSAHEFVARADSADGARYLELHEPDSGDDTFRAARTIWVARRPGQEPVPREIEADVVVLGAGPAGLAASIALARSRRRVVVLDEGNPRNAPAEGVHNVLGNEGRSPHELRARGRAEAESYGVSFVSGAVAGISGTIDDFTVEGAGGAVRVRVRARRVILATGLIDDLPDISGVAQGWGRTVLHCPFCHGWEVQDQRIGILTRGEVAIHQVMLFRQLSDHITLFLHDGADPTAEQREQLEAMNVAVVRPKVKRLLMDGALVRAVEVEGGETIAADAVAVVPRFNARTAIYERLGGEGEEVPFGRRIPTDSRGMTDVPGVWAAGNAADPMSMVVGSAASGLTTGAAVHGDITLADLNRAVQERRAGD